jgi:RHS repeat-associated protein
MPFRVLTDADSAGGVVDVIGSRPLILMELNGSGGIERTYIHANGQIIAQHAGDHTADRYFYLHDRLGSVRLLIDTSANVENRYIYDPFGELHDSSADYEETITNPFMFTGQYFDADIDQYYLRARRYDPHLARFTSRDPVFGKFEEPLTLHVYLYCINDPINLIDPAGLWAYYMTGGLMASMGPSVAGQWGIVWDDKGNVGFITIVGGGLGSPYGGGGVSIGITDAEDILQLRGEGGAVGFGVGKGILGGGADYIWGKKYTGIEFNFGVGTTVYPGLPGEWHYHETYTTVRPFVSETLTFEQIVGMQMEEAFDEAQTLGEWWAILHFMTITDMDLMALGG